MEARVENLENKKEKFEGFDPRPQSWQFPMIINGWVHKLSGSEFKILWYILRHTYGWQKGNDYISYRQFRYGIRRKDGGWVDRGTGLSFPAIKRGIDGLIKLGFIEIEKQRGEKGRQGITIYKPRFKNVKSGNSRLNRTDSVGLNQSSEATIYNNRQYITNNNSYMDITNVISSKGLISLISKFKAVNPLYENLFSNITQRKALQRLVDKFGEEKMSKLLDALPETINDRFAPRITTPLQLENKFAELVMHFKKKKVSSMVVKI